MARRQILRRTTFGAAAAGALLAAAAMSPAAAAPPPVDLQILSFNDYHGHLQPPAGADSQLPGQGTTAHGGVEYLSSTLTQLRAGKKHSLTVAAGDLIGGSPFLSGLFHDEPSVESLDALGLDVSSVGNHEFDEGVPELLRMQYGGCRADTGCYLPTPYPGADFQWLAANVTYNRGVRVSAPAGSTEYGSWFKRRTGRTVLPPTWVKDVDGVKVGFIGMTLEATNTLVAQAGIRDVSFRDEVATANLAAADLSQRGVKAMVVLLHEGGVPPSGATYDFPCTGETGAAPISGPIVDIARNLDPKIDMVVSGHTHQPYTCVIPDPAGNPRSVTSAMSFGRLVTETNLKLDRRSKDVIRSMVTSVNRPVVRTVAADPVQSAIVAKWDALSAPLGNRIVGAVTADVTRALNANGSTDNRAAESALADLIADAQLDRTVVNGAQIAFMNSGGVRSDLLFAQATGEGDGNVTYAEAFRVQPFSNLLITLTLTGAQIDTVLEQQFNAARARPVLINGVSRGFTYSYSASAGEGSKIDPTSIKLNGVTLDPAAGYRVTVNNFLADGGDSFTGFVAGTNRVGGGVDLDEFVAWLGDNSPVAGLAVNTSRIPDPPRITVLP